MTAANAQKISVENRLRQYKKKSQMRTIWNRLKKNRLAIFGLALFLVMLAVVSTADIYYNYEQDAIAQHLSLRFKGPGQTAGHPLGTDQYGRDVLARVIYGGPPSLFVGPPPLCWRASFPAAAFPCSSASPRSACLCRWDRSLARRQLTTAAR